MPSKDKYSDPKLREEVKEEIQQSDKGGEPGQWSARKAQMMAKEYKKRGGDYNTPKSSKDESQKNLDKWGDEDWQTKEGSGEAKQEDGSRKRYLPKKAWEQMSEEEKERTDQKKQEESKNGKQFVGNTGKAKKARKEAAEDSDNKSSEEEEQDDDDDDDNKGSRSSSSKQKKSPDKRQGQNKQKPQQKGKESRKEDAESDGGSDTSETSQKSSQKENQSPPQGQKRSRSWSKQPDDDRQGQKKKRTSNSGSTFGSKHDSSEAPARQGSTSRLPKNGQKNVHWKAMPGWVEGEVVAVVQKDQEVEGKKVKASKDDPKVVLKSKSSGKICVHKADNVYFD